MISVQSMQLNEGMSWGYHIGGILDWTFYGSGAGPGAFMGFSWCLGLKDPFPPPLCIWHTEHDFHHSVRNFCNIFSVWFVILYSIWQRIKPKKKKIIVPLVCYCDIEFGFFVWRVIKTDRREVWNSWCRIWISFCEFDWFY